MSFEKIPQPDYLKDEKARDKGFVKRVQSKAFETTTMGIFRNLELATFADDFSDNAISLLEKMEQEKTLPYSILPEYKEKIYEYFRETLRVHVGAFYKANNQNFRNSPFDLGDTSEEIELSRRKYIVELMAIAMENIIVTGGKDETSIKLAKYRDAEWVRSFLDGSYIHDYLAERYNDNDIKKLLSFFPLSWRMIVAINNIKNPEKALDGIAENYLVTLSDEGIRKHFEGRLSEENVNILLGSLSSSLRMRIAFNNIKNPEKALDDIAKNYLDTLSDEGIRKHFEGRLSDGDVHVLIGSFPLSWRMQISITNIKNPEKALDDIAKNYLDTLSDEGIRKHFEGRLSDEGINALLANFPMSSRIRIAIGKIKNTEKALDDIAKNYLDTLSDEGIRKHFEGRLSEENVNVIFESFSSSLRMLIATSNIKNPEKALDDIAKNYLDTLSDEGIRKHFEGCLSKENVDVLLENFSMSWRMQISITNIKNPEKALDDIAKNYLDTLSDEGIRKHFEGRLSDEGINALLANFPMSSRIRIAIGKIKNTEKALDDIAKNYLDTLSDEGIRKHFEGRLSDGDVNVLIGSFPLSWRMQIAISSIKNPEKALDDIAEGRMSLNHGLRLSFSLRKD